MVGKKNKPETFVELIDLFGIEELAKILKLEYVLVQKMRFRNSIKVDYWPKIAEASKHLGYGKRVYLEDIHTLRSGRDHHPGTRAKEVRKAVA